MWMATGISSSSASAQCGAIRSSSGPIPKYWLPTSPRTAKGRVLVQPPHSVRGQGRTVARSSQGGLVRNQAVADRCVPRDGAEVVDSATSRGRCLRQQFSGFVRRLRSPSRLNRPRLARLRLSLLHALRGPLPVKGGTFDSLIRGTWGGVPAFLCSERLADTEEETAPRLALAAVERHTVVAAHQEPRCAHPQPDTDGPPQVG